MLCSQYAEAVNQELAQLGQGDLGSVDRLVALAYDWLGRRVVAVLRSYPSIRLPADEILHDRVLGRLRNVLPQQLPPDCAAFTRLADRRIRSILREIVRDQKEQPRQVSLEAMGGDEGGRDWLADPAVDDLLDEAVKYGEWQKFHAAAAALDEPLRRAFCLRYYGGLSEAEVAADLGVGVRTVSNYWRRALDGISAALTGKSFEELVAQLPAGENPFRFRRPPGAGEGSPLCPSCPPSSAPAD